MQQDKETGLYIGSIPNLPGAHTQARSLDELNINLKELITFCLEEINEDELASNPERVSFQNISVAI